MKKNIVTKFNLYETKNLKDRDVEIDNTDFDFDDVDIKEPTEDVSTDIDNDKQNEKEYENLHSAVEGLINDTIGENSSNKDNLLNTIKEDNIDAANLKGFTEENDIYDFYLKYQFEIDERLDDINYFDEPANKYGITGLYDYSIQGTKIAVQSLIEDM